ncbi:MAG: peptidoglycan editing factor PgeF [Proteobacteria bacterium]|nr:peptidoglycan editing factor PgeF [Pseudomonadota bacterium]
MQTPELIRPDWDVPDCIEAWVTTRTGGCSNPPYASFNMATHVGDSSESLRSNRLQLQAILPTALRFQWLRQVHGTDVVQIQCPEEQITADGLITRVPGIACCVLTADCLPVFLANKQGDEIAIAHAGWRGMLAGILEKTIMQMSSSPDALVAWLGPAIGSCHFEVGEEVREQFLNAHGSLDKLSSCFVQTENPGKYLADLYAIARCKLNHLGVAAVSGGDFCTHCDQDRFFSYRRDGTTGRMASLIYIAAPIQ